MIPRGVVAVGGALALVAIAASGVAAREQRGAAREHAYAERDRAAFDARTRAYEIAMRARPSDGGEARVKAWSRALEIDPSWAAARVELAEARFDRARELASSDPGAARAELEAAVRDADVAVERGAGARAYYVKGRALDELGDDKLARDAYFEAARTATWEDAFIRHASLAALALHEGRYRDALDESSRALDEVPAAPDAIAIHARASELLRSAP